MRQRIHFPDQLSGEDIKLLQSWAETLRFRPVPSWLGDFQFRLYGDAYGRNHGKLPPEIKEVAQKLMAMRPNVQFTTVFVQRYETGSSVKRHRDPRNNLDCTIIAPFGQYTDAYLKVDGWGTHEVLPRDVVILPCTVNGVQGPYHELTPVGSGTRYALILNRIKE